ncbi:MAG: hypothetical protein COA50_16410 [Flavobacteriaceae bacterium]|nr:MAG: hypothetical protein COA50_16410 [Flavobacteriaceae bacterium]
MEVKTSIPTGMDLFKTENVDSKGISTLDRLIKDTNDRVYMSRKGSGTRDAKGKKKKEHGHN